MAPDAQPSGTHYFSEEPDSPDERRTLEVRLRGHDFSVTTSNGVFSADRVDLGTSVLLREVPAPAPRGALLDLGCGWGPIALALAFASPKAEVWAVDINARARDLTLLNARAAGATGVRVAAPDEVPADVRFDTIWSNPPIRVGKAELHTLLERWLVRLAPEGEAYLVVQRHLGADSLHAWMSERLPELMGPGVNVSRLGSAKGFRVLRVSAPAPSDARDHPDGGDLGPLRA